MVSIGLIKMNLITNIIEKITPSHKVGTIPKIIHYVWVGDTPLNKSGFGKYWKSWKKYNPDYNFMLWDENNIDFSTPHLKEVYGLKNWAHLANLVRLQVIYQYGGIYLDTDMLVIKSFDKLLDNQCFFGFQLRKHPTHWVNNAVIGATKNHWFIKKMIDYIIKTYDGSQMATLAGPVTVTTLLKKEGLKSYSNKGVRVKDIFIYPVETFYPFWYEERFKKSCIKENTLAIHFWKKRWK